MNEDSNFASYIYLSNSKFIISVIQIENLKIVYEQEIFINNKSNNLEFEKLQNFLDKNILNLEKILNHFIKNISVIIDTNDFFPINLSVKNNNNGNFLTLENLSFSLNDAKYQCKKTMEQMRIIHTLIENYHIDDKNYPFLPKELKCNNFSLDIKFICLQNNVIKNLEKCLQKYQISINQILSANYIKSFFKDNSDLFLKAWQITEGCNPNEVKFYNKTLQNQGFFERFFNFFR